MESTLHKFNAEIDTKFIIFSQVKPNGEYIVLNDRESLHNSQFNATLPVRIICGGYLSSPITSAPHTIRQAYVAQNRFNVIVVDWSLGSRTFDYPKASFIYSPTIGRVIARFIEFLVTSPGVAYDNIYLIGHSLGAHILGIAGKHTKEKVNTIFGIDPSGPIIAFAPPSLRLSRGDGKYIEVIHTNGNNFGILAVSGDVDFYVNGGKVQPGCEDPSSLTCSHNRAAVYFAESICTDENNYWAIQCSKEVMNACNCESREFLVKMGGDPSNAGTQLKGTFYLETNSRTPFAKGKRLG